MTGRLFQRQYELQIDDTLIKHLHCKFKVEASLEKEPNTTEIEVSNLSRETRDKAKVKGAFLQLKAGYPANIGVIFSGDVKLADHVRKGANWETKIRAGDGERIYQYKKVAISHKPDTSVSDVCKNLVGLINQQLGGTLGSAGLKLNEGNLKSFIDQLPPNYQTFKSGFSQYDNAIHILHRICKSAGFRFSIQGNRALFFPENPTKDQLKESAILLTPQNGLIGSPEHSTPDKKDKKPPTLKAVSLLQPQIKVGGVIQIKSERIDGTYYAHKVTHEGDTSGGDWYTKMELRPL